MRASEVTLLRYGFDGLAVPSHLCTQSEGIDGIGVLCMMFPRGEIWIYG